MTPFWRGRLLFGALVLVGLSAAFVAGVFKGAFARENARPVVVCRDVHGHLLTVQLRDGDTYRCMVTDDDFLVLPKVTP